MERIPEPEYMDLDDEAEAYAAADFSDVNAAFVERLTTFADPLTTATALDLGTGPGDIPALVAASHSAWQIVAADAAFAMLAIARGAVARKQVSLVQTDAKALPFRAGSFQVVFSNSILHHIPDPVAMWEEVRHVVQPGGLVFFRDLARPDSEQEAARLVEEHAGSESELLKEEFYRSLLAAFTPDEIREQLSAAGLPGLQVQLVTDRHLDVYGRAPELT